MTKLATTGGAGYAPAIGRPAQPCAPGPILSSRAQRFSKPAFSMEVLDRHRLRQYGSLRGCLCCLSEPYPEGGTVLCGIQCARNCGKPPCQIANRWLALSEVDRRRLS